MYVHEVNTSLLLPFPHTVASVPITTWPSKEQRDGGDILAAEIKAAKCHKELKVSTICKYKA